MSRITRRSGTSYVVLVPNLKGATRALAAKADALEVVIVASEMLTGAPGIGGFLWQEYNSLIYAHILLAILTIGFIGFALDRLMALAESRLRTV